MKIIIPVAGAGARLRPHTYTQPKPLIPLAGKTIISVIIDQFIEEGYDEFIFIIGYLGEKIKNYIQEKYPLIIADFITQEERGGTGHAIYLCKELVHEDEELFIIYGDTICDYSIKDFMNADHSILGVKRVDDPRDFGVAELDDQGQVKHVVEKPLIPKSNLALVGVYKIKESAALFEAMEDNLKVLEAGSEYPLTTAIESMLNKGIHFEAVKVEHWFDCGKKETLLETNATLLSQVAYASQEVLFFDNTIIIHPVSIADGCDIKNCIIGPNVTIAEKTSIEAAILSNSIIGSYSNIKHVVLDHSLIGSDAVILGKNQSLNVGDNTELDLS